MVVLFQNGRNLVVDGEYCMEEVLDIALSTEYCLTRIYLAKLIVVEE